MKVNNPHDKFFKESLSRVEVAKGFMENYLPEKLLNLIDLDNIIIEKDSFIEKELEEYFSDILYRVSLKGKEAYLYFLFEHKSYPYKKITIQLLQYMLNIWELKLKQKKEGKLPLIIPMVVYHGKDRWNIGVKLSDIVEDIPKEVEEYFPDYKYLLYDLSSYSDEEIKGTGILRVFLEILSSLYKDDFEERFKEALIVLERLREQNQGIEYFETVVRYILNAKDGLEFKDLKDMADKISTKRGEDIMTIADQLRREGRIEGKVEGKMEGKVEIAQNLLKKGMSTIEVMDITELPKKKIEEIKKKSQH
ncbi:Rpn family recombination-promoting nuclease/putative transposase [Halonatronum saccharophilum]|uniref:Rpn family recombination-promoting nuclease/putative transposase n=1 Tax=Halonatronum saccharophilum TaxID=150060 RepID=UPI00047F94BE|nr:Rpn family recombination-promoting nuclease/putative transposase [Halonatronum saccharophilum]